MNIPTHASPAAVTTPKHVPTPYEIHPTYPASGDVYEGYPSLVARLLDYDVCLIDGYSGVDWVEIVLSISDQATAIGKKVKFSSVSDAMLPEEAINRLVAPFLGGDDPLFGHKTDLQLEDFFDTAKLAAFSPDHTADLHLVYGCGAALLPWDVPVFYVDIPKNEIQRRMKAGSHRNLGASLPASFKSMYKRCYFVDWVILNKHKQHLLPRMEGVADQQTPGTITWIPGTVLRDTLHEMSKSYFRVRPWFEPGVWGGDWMKRHFGLDRSAPNYAWSFEMIVPENGLLIRGQRHAVEISFDMLMYQEKDNVLGKATRRFGYDFPIRFDFLDTFNGGNLSLQCHPTPHYAKKHFGEAFTQDETYYIVDAAPDANVYLGFQEDIDPVALRQALEDSFDQCKALDVAQFVQVLPSRKHELFLIPNGTVHCSGVNNLVLEISATPYIFTFKMYDWLRPDLDGHPRPLNIDRAFDNLNFERKGNVVQETLIAKPRTVREGSDWSCIHLPTHPDHFYDIHRYEFDSEVTIQNDGQCHVLMLVEGAAITLETSDGKSVVFHFAETFAVPAATREYRLMNRGTAKAKVVVAFVKDDAC